MKKLIDECDVLKLMLGEDNISVFKDKLNDIKMAVTADMVNIRYTQIPYHHYGDLKPSGLELPDNQSDGSEYLDYLDRVEKLNKPATEELKQLNALCVLRKNLSKHILAKKELRMPLGIVLE